MNPTEIKQAFEEKLGKNYAHFVTEWLALQPTEFIEKAEEIAATKLMAELLPEAASTDQMEYLLRFSNPLEVVRDKWIEENGSEMVHDDEMSHALWSITDKQDTEQDYELDEAFLPPEQEVRMC